jgi:hypothetical protein
MLTEGLVPVKVELPSGAWIQIRDKLMADDKFAVQSSFTIPVDEEGRQQMPSGIQNIMRNALLERIIEAWGGGPLEGQPPPAQNIQGVAVIGQLLDIEDYNALAEAVDPMLEKVTFAGPNRRTRNGTQPR